MAKNFRSNQRVSQVDQRLAANLHLRQVETLIDADDISNRIGGIFDKAGRRILDIATDSISAAAKIDAIGRLLMQSLVDSRGRMGGEFEKLANRSYRTAADALIDSIPWPWLATLIAPDEAGAIESVLHPQPAAWLNFDAGMITIDSVDITEEEAKPYTFSTPLDALRKAKLTDKEKRDLASKLIFPPPDARMVAETLTRGDWSARLDSLSGQITNSRALIGELVTGYSDGEGVAALKKRIEPLVGGIKSSAQRIARTEAMRVAEAMQREAWEPLGDMMIGAQIIAVLDERTRPEHATRNGQIYYKNPAGAQRSMAELPALPDAPNCVLPGQAVGGMISGGLKAFYSGKAIEITMATGRAFSVTPNHPVLTKDGFVPACKINEGDNLVGNLADIEIPCGMADNVQECPSLIEDVFNTIAAKVFATEAMVVDFHGDEIGIDGNVQVVNHQRILLNNIDAATDEGIDDKLLAVSDVKSLFKAGVSSQNLGGDAIEITSSSSPRLGQLAIHRDTIGFDSFPLEFLGIGSTAKLHASFLEMVGQAEPGVSTLFRYLIDRFAGFVSLDKVAKVRYFDYSGHVYDLQSETGWYTCNGIIIHNCRCMASPVLSPPPDLATNKSLRDALASSEPSGLPDPATYDNWFKDADPGRRKLVVGVGRYNAMEKYLREQGLKRDLQWTDFIDSQGRLLPAADLLAESSFDRQARKQLVGNQIRMRGKALADLSRQGFERFRRPDKIKVVNSGGLQYRKPPAGEAQDEVLVEVSAAKLNSNWQRDAGFIASDGTGAIGDRLAGAKAFIASGEPIDASQVRMRDDGTVVFVDGRHRFAAVRDAGKRTVVVSVPRDQAAAVRDRLSV